MYSVKLGFNEAVKRVNALIANGHRAEALLTSVFTCEKTCFRMLRQLVVSSGFASVQADKLMQKFRGFENIKDVWECFDPKHEKLSAFIPKASLDKIKVAQEMRNNLVHGKRVYALAECEAVAKDVLVELEVVRKAFESRYGYDGWSTVKSRKRSKLHTDPRVTV
ncbi:MAG: hypothetical protein IV097_08830 [Burkholderiaceae bacterium]|nr:hypothetical protein [Burkholderiaceae bacterium]